MAEGRHDFVIVIPVADRPRQLAACLESLAALLERHPYPGRVSVLIAEDSRAPDHVARHRALAEDFNARGIAAHHLGQAEQRALIETLPADLRARLSGVIGDPTRDLHHKGASITRNLACLWLARLPRDGARRLFWFVDSDQAFYANLQTATGEEQPRVIDYLHWLDRIFAERPVRLVTGKVVGDPPVSPAVMAGHFLDDVLAFLAELADLPPQAPCAFHGLAARPAGDAAYHDMADLFGFKPAAETWRHRCRLIGAHDHVACLADFAARVGRFLDGEHLTRRAFYQPDDPMASLRPARTVYTGNYVVDAMGLRWFIPFADLGLRMAGPTLGRILRAELGDTFVSANLPMLHGRAVEDLGQAEFRPGMVRGHDSVDLSGEYERQYFGDVMLFAVERLAEQGFPGAEPDAAAICRAVDASEARLRQLYGAKRGEISAKLSRLDAFFSDPRRWWHRDANLAGARQAMRRFLDDLRRNFGDDARAWQRIGSDAHREWRKAAIRQAIARYRDEREAWRVALEGA
ncbi:MAG: hypothetical protein MUC79_02675 [Thiobacillaceae bacterium]|jgi:hypothetical protein|nr:hypothetical protein [Thiobacillaceae bacterium]